MPAQMGSRTRAGNRVVKLAQARIQPFLGQCIATIEPNRQSAARLDLAGDFVRTPAAGPACGAERRSSRRGRRRASASGKVEEIGLENRDVLEPATKLCRFEDGSAQVDTDERCAVRPDEASISSAAAAGVENEPVGAVPQPSRPS